jgi:hypothetical protein
MIGGIVSIFGLVFGWITTRNAKADKKRAESQAEIGRLRNERDTAEDEKNEAHDALSRQVAKHLITGNDTETLEKLAKAADASVVKWQETEKRLSAEMEKIWAAS